MKYFIREKVLEFIRKDPKKFRETKGHIELFFFPDAEVKDPNDVMIGDQKLVEIHFDLEKLAGTRVLGMM